MSNNKKITIPKSNRLCKINKIAFYGSADLNESDHEYAEAFAAAKHAAKRGKVIVNGGGPGIMEASTRGAKAGGGKTLVVTFYPEDLPEFEGRAEQNIADKEIRTANYIERMFGLMDNADLFVCFKGGTGTLSEWATAWLLAHLYYGNHKPLILYGEFWHEFMDVVHKNFMIGYKEAKVYRIVSNLEEFKVALRIFEEEMTARRLK